MSKVRNFTVVRWISILSVLGVILSVTIWQTNTLIFLFGTIYAFTFLVAVFWPCPHCQKPYGLKWKKFAGICWPYAGFCLNCFKSPKTKPN